MTSAYLHFLLLRFPTTMPLGKRKWALSASHQSLSFLVNGCSTVGADQELSSEEVTSEPPDTVASLPEAVFMEPPDTADDRPDASLLLPPDTVASLTDAVFVEPPETVAD
eukprot:CAMPEP_0113319760 /NCGR_PEP_ID=MMETSP0010_2-20120614/13833_1 /TAXON_ID=216773 ORGANISM="Corethron hystrix, Strain 308" /NCGR_SAMPLE_ID=MMETSP0010_2 /ASSEMBLY_ACC=CAM_ASM_000155 /LENGTH=109 /DNA_ID=CAMNT_0000177393 /DNA_START=515 /DNA_END=844 /DNA_ORIENTATION=+ /assembly_acc=CAM_ASM_000155